MSVIKNIVSIFQTVELRVFIIISTLLQIILTMGTYLLGNIFSQSLKRVIWLSLYMAAEFSSNLALGAVFQDNFSSGNGKDKNNKFLSALWAPFILLHLGGHNNNMASSSLEDHEYRLKHVLNFLYYEITALLICILAVEDTQVRFPFIILFIIGTLKFGERIWALKQGCISLLRDKMLKEVFVDVQPNIPIAHRRGTIEYPYPTRPDDISQLQRLCEAFTSFDLSKGIYANANPLHYTRRDYNQVQSFHLMEAPQVFIQIKNELSFAHDFFYTKTFTSNSIAGWVIRFLSLASIISATALFSCTDKNGFYDIDVEITYFLLVVALILEVFSFSCALLSNYTMVQVRAMFNQRRHVEVIESFQDWKEMVKGFIFWAKQNLVGQFAIVDYGIKESKTSPWVKSLFDLIGLKEHLNNNRHTRYVSLDDPIEQRNCIFTKVREALQEHLPDRYRRDAMPEIFRTLVSNNVSNRLSETLRENAKNRNLEECLIVWHIATYVCFAQWEPTPNEENLPSELVYAKFLSEYMLYLLAMNPSMVSHLATDELRTYQTVCSVLFRKFEGFNERENVNEIVERLAMRPDTDGPEKLLAQGCEVAEELMIDSQWNTLFCLWIDVLCYAAINCQGKHHAQQLGAGGQLLTYVWLFLKHLVGEKCDSTQEEGIV